MAWRDYEDPSEGRRFSVVDRQRYSIYLRETLQT